MATYKRVTLNIPSSLIETFDARVIEAEFPNDAAYALSLFLFDVMCRKEHKVTHKLVLAHPSIRDKVFQDIADAFERGENVIEKVGWLDRELDRLITEREAAKSEEKKAPANTED